MQVPQFPCWHVNGALAGPRGGRRSSMVSPARYSMRVLAASSRTTSDSVSEATTGGVGDRARS